MASLIVFRTSSAVPAPTAANSMPSPIEHRPCSVQLTATGNVVFNLLPAREWRSLIPLPVKPAGKMPSSIFHIYCNGGAAIPHHVRRRAEEAFDHAASTFVKLVADGNDLAGREYLTASYHHHLVTDQAIVAKPSPVRYTTAQRAAIARAAAAAASRRPAKVMAPAPPPVRGGYKRVRSAVPVKAKAKPKVEVQVKSILKPARSSNVEYVKHCIDAPPIKGRLLRAATENIRNSTCSRFPTAEWRIDHIPINARDWFDRTVLDAQEARKARGEEGPLAPKVVSVPPYPSIAILLLSLLLTLQPRNFTSTWYRTRGLLTAGQSSKTTPPFLIAPNSSSSAATVSRSLPAHHCHHDDQQFPLQHQHCPLLFTLTVITSIH